MVEVPPSPAEGSRRAVSSCRLSVAPTAPAPIGRRRKEGTGPAPHMPFAPARPVRASRGGPNPRRPRPAPGAPPPRPAATGTPRRPQRRDEGRERIPGARRVLAVSTDTTEAVAEVV